MSQAPFHFMCVAPDHVPASSETDGRAYVSPVTVHQGKWAYCAAGVATKHDWRAIPPTSRAELNRRTRLAEKT